MYLIIFAICLNVFLSINALSASPMPPMQVVVVSIDALHPNALTKENSPHLVDIMQRGHYTLRGTSTQPPKTLIAHSAMITGHEQRQNNDWKPGEPTIAGSTIFDWAKSKGMATAFYYSKPKLGYLQSRAVDSAALSPDDAQGHAERFLAKNAHAFAFVHISGLDWQGPVTGWLSPGYNEVLRFIDKELKTLIDSLAARKNFLLIVTSDHAGHGKIHGSDHPEDDKLPLIAWSDTCNTSHVTDKIFHVTMLASTIESLLRQCVLPPK
ncbi:alkaline phosphatase family protein [Chrysiogenes arsenatis]|uniref:alkaline phosphatase family protein n=1 Tax=Chrysiogenes arsenatis TaxID=309797 RepID=UPI00042091D9|nr:alkaline phosphatase family protein [Chrysiogenes arsenatis]